MAEQPPRRRIVFTAGYAPRTRLGILRTAELECGHLTTCNATERRQGWLFCWDCFYHRPVPGSGSV